jgi:alkaline phosphatase
MAKYFGISDLTADEVKKIQAAKKGNMNYAVGPMISERSVIGWTTNGHTGEDVFLYAYGPGRPSGTIENTDLAKLSAKGMKLDLTKADAQLFVEAGEGFAAIGAKVELDKTDNENPVLVVTKGAVRAELPVSKNIIRINNVVKELPGLTVLAAKTGKVYVPQQAVELVKKAS